MPNNARFNGCIGRIELDFVERVCTPIPIMKLGIQLHLGGLSLANTISILDSLGYHRARSTVHNWIQKADLAPEAGRAPDQIALDETVVKVNGERYWLYMAVDPETNDILHLRLFPSRTTVLTKRFLRELADNHAVEDAEFLVDGAPWLQAGLFELGMHFRHETFGDRNPVERVFQEIKRRTNQFYNTFSHADPATAENWLQALGWAWNELI